MSDNEVLIGVNGVSKKFCRSLKRSLRYGLQDVADEILGREGGHDELRKGEFWAVSDVSFELKRGECLGLIGRNGAGKTTLLRILNGLIKPDKGCITMRGRVGALIALGAGFNPILTGRENIYVNASVLGLRKREIEEKLEDIIDFADIREFIDAPVQSYSSGMQVRLGFAVATTLDPDVLLLDEVLAVGDAGFRHKCYSRIGRMQQKCAVIFVSHSMEFVSQICDRVVHMDHGVAKVHENVMDGVEAYNMDNVNEQPSNGEGDRAIYPPVRSADFRVGRRVVAYGDQVELTLSLDVNEPFRQPVLTVAICNEAGKVAALWSTLHNRVDVRIPAGRSEVRFPVGPLWLLPGKYSLNVAVREAGNAEHNLWFYNQSGFTMMGDCPPAPSVSVLLPYQGHVVDVKGAQRKA